jgi:heme/copper-type cytochrome/quinol oxidase subunit 3
MAPPPRFTGDLAHLPTHAFGHRSLTWWGIIGFMVIEGGFFALTIAVYFYLMSQEHSWPPPPFAPPNVIAGTLFTLVMLASEIPNSVIKRAAEHGRLREVRRLMLVMVGIGVVLLVIRGFEFNSLNVLWYDNAYGSIVWALLVLHTTHILTDWGDTLVLAGLMHTKHGIEGRRFVDVSENALYWYFVVLVWLPIYGVIYWAPRLM